MIQHRHKYFSSWFEGSKHSWFNIYVVMFLKTASVMVWIELEKL